MRLFAAVIALAMTSQSGLAKAQTLEKLPSQGAHYLKQRRSVVEEAMKAETAFRKAIALDPKNASAYIDLGVALQVQRLHVEAEDAYRQAIALDPKNARAFFKLSNALSDQLKYVAAVAALRQAIALDPDYGKYESVDRFLKEQQKIDEKVKAYRQEIALDPKNVSHYLRLGGFLEDEWRYEEAEAVFRQALSLGDKNRSVYIYFELGELLRLQKKYEAAEAAYRQTLAYPSFMSRPTSFFRLGEVLMRQMKYAAAEAATRQALSEGGGSYKLLGDALKYQKKYVLAEAAYRQAIANEPNVPQLHNDLGLLLMEQKKYVAAEAAYKKAIAIDPASPYVYYNLEELNRLIGINSGKYQELKPQDTAYLPKDPLTPVRRSVVRIVPTFSGDRAGHGLHGTGFVVRRQGGKSWILTARHVIFDSGDRGEAVSITVELYGGNLPEGIVEARLQAQVAKSGEDDLALLVVVGLPEDIQPLNFASLPVKDGMPLTMVGHPRQEEWKNVTATLLTSSMSTLLVNSAQMADGGSGSPVLSDKKEVIGMVYQNQTAGDILQVWAYSLAKLQATMRQWGP